MALNKEKPFSKIKKKISFIKSVIQHLTLIEILNLFINNFVIFDFTRIYYFFRSTLDFKDPNCIYNYQRYLKKNKGNRNRQKKVLLSFLRYPIYKEHYIGRLKFFFSSNGLVLNILRALNELGYNVDIIDIYDKNFIPKEKYDIFLVHTAQNFRNIYKKINKDIIKICFDTGCYWKVHNKKEKERFRDLKRRKNINLSLDRYICNGENIEFMLSHVDAIISLGEDFTRESYSRTPFAKKLFTLNNAFYKDKYYKGGNKNYIEARKNFLFFSGGGNIHKGLDLLLEAFVKTDLHLYVCTDFDIGFREIYHKELDYPNIHHIGYLKQGTERFYNIINKCAFNIHPSCSEGSPGGVIDLMQYGIIPIVTKESNINVGNFGVLIREHNINEICHIVEELSKESVDLLKKRSKEIKKIAFNRFSENLFLENFKNHIHKITSIKNNKHNL